MSSQTENVQSFERRSGRYETSPFQGLFFDRIHRVALRAVPPGLSPESILDIGCGTGRLLRKTGACWPEAHLFGVDPAQGRVSEARCLTPQAQFQAGLAESLPFPQASVDLVLSTTSFHHWQDQPRAIMQVRRVLRPGGVFVLVDIHPPLGLTRMLKHGRQTAPAAVRQMFVEAGREVALQRRVWGGFLIITVGRRAR